MTRKAEIVRFMLRLSPALHDELRRLAAREHRSLHAQILYMLERALHDEREEKRPPRSL